MKLLWTGIRSSSGMKNNHANVVNKLKDINGNLITDSTAMANILHNSFGKGADGVTKNIPRSLKSPLEYLDNKNLHSFFIFPAAPCEISNALVQKW